MKKFFYRTFAFLLLFSMMSGLTVVLAEETYPDLSGHWAEQTLRAAISATLLKGDGSGIHPDNAVTGAEVVELLCRVLAPQKLADLSAVSDISKSDWFYDAAAKAVAMGLITPTNGRLNLKAPMIRSKAFSMLAEAFQLVRAEQDTSVLNAYSDGSDLYGQYRLAAAALVQGGYVTGYGGALHINDNMTRAEFLTILFRIAANYPTPGEAVTMTGGTVLSGDDRIVNITSDSALYFNGSATSVQLQNVSLPTAVIRSANLQSLSLSGCRIDRLVLAAASGDVTYTANASSTIAALAVGTGSGTVTLTSRLSQVEVTGSHRTVIISAPVETLLISGSGNEIIISPGAVVSTVKIGTVGTGNTITQNGSVSALTLYGSETVISGSGSIQALTDNAVGSTVSLSAQDATVNETFGLNTVSLALAAPAELPSYQSLGASVTIDAPANTISCRGAWYVDDTYVSSSAVTLGKTAKLSLNKAIPASAELPVTVTVTFVLSCTTSDGIYVERRADRSVTLLNTTKFDAKEVLSLVKTGYKGNYTLEWAQTHDYDDALKVAWVDAKGYSSKTEYLIWVSIAYQRVNIFTGSTGNWTLSKSYIVGTGASGKDTPIGVFKIIGRNPKGWTTDKYTVKPVVNFINSAYAFHSRLYYPGTTTVEDKRIGFPVSHGCVRMYDEDVAWIYDNIPTGTTVVVY
ncbi:S-layer homology domain-containing protein [Oscillospiraceae bacterium CM]|nr:S-layer homology domain-containing protein [Oscillospiraceae bacterium CM]